MNPKDDCFWEALQSTMCKKEMKIREYNHKFLDMLSGCQFWTEEYKGIMQCINEISTRLQAGRIV